MVSAITRYVQGYVEMTGIDSETSQDIAEAISLKGGRYLEAQIQGSKNQAQDGTLVILVAGDRSLFDDCQSCFQVRPAPLLSVSSSVYRRQIEGIIGGHFSSHFIHFDIK